MNSLQFLKPIQVKGKIRIGRNYDGGYVVYENALCVVDTLLTYGVGWDTDFEERFQEMTSKDVYMFDPTMFNGAKVLNRFVIGQFIARFQFGKAIRYFNWAKTWQRQFNMLKSKGIHFVNEGISTKKSLNYDALGNHLVKYGLVDKQLLLKIDVEGAEYDVFLDKSIYPNLKNVVQIIIEWHDLKRKMSCFKGYN